MDTHLPGWTLGELAERLRGTLDGPADLRILRAAPTEADDPEAMGFAQSAEFVRRAEASQIGAILAPLDAPPSPKPMIRVAQPRETFGAFLAMVRRPLPLAPGISPQASVSSGATIDPTAMVGPFAVIESGAKIGPRVRIFPFAYIGENSVIGADAVVYPHAVLYQDVEIGARAIVHAGAVLGADGFGFVWDGKRRIKVPQVGRTVLADDTEVGANATIDRATMGETSIGLGTKIDNLVQVAHNVKIGEHTVIASLSGISGSVTVGDRCTLAGQVGTKDHVFIADDVTLGGRTGVTSSLPETGVYWGTPAKPLPEQLRLEVLFKRLPELNARVKELERRLAALESE